MCILFYEFTIFLFLSFIYNPFVFVILSLNHFTHSLFRFFVIFSVSH